MKTVKMNLTNSLLFLGIPGLPARLTFGWFSAILVGDGEMYSDESSYSQFHDLDG
jgi:hypothetical protein